RQRAYDKELSQQNRFSPTPKSPDNQCFHSALLLHYNRPDIYSLSLLGCKLSFWTNLSQMNKFHSGSWKDKLTSKSNKAA
uniref:Uncharacterized protein n=1 Tax=Phocoena sinus TaxID=42100 RepID=A0A8C9CCW1_PHOSS